MEEAAEQALIARCRSGSDAAFSELVDRYKNLVYAVILRTIDDRSRADDLAQEVFLRVFRGLPEFRGDSTLATWLFRITPVSYTHLRAHETPEHLVCRLL